MADVSGTAGMQTGMRRNLMSIAVSRSPSGGEVHVWKCDLEAGTAHPESYYSLLSPDERERASLYRFERHRTAYVAGRGILRELLGGYLDREPASIAFGCGSHGKPFLVDSRGTDRLQFNLSHSAGMLLIAVTRGEAIGVDVELRRPLTDILPLARNTFSAYEFDRIRRLSEPERLAAFYDCWTRKEAFAKAHGAGLSMDLKQFDVAVEPDGSARLLRVAWDGEEVSQWALLDLPVAGGYSAALAVHGRVKRIIRQEWKFLRCEHQIHIPRRGIHD